MRVRMPDGVIIDNVPGGISQDELLNRYKAKQSRDRLVSSNPAEYDPSSPEWKAQNDPTSGMSGVGKFVAGASSQIRGLGRGIRDTIANAAMVGDPNRGAIDAALREREDERRRLDAPLMQTPEAKAGAVTGAIAATAPLMAIPGAQSVTGGALVGGAIGLSQPAGTGESRTKNAATGAAFGGGTNAAIKTVGRVFQPTRTVPSVVDARAIKTLEDAGVSLDTAQKSGSPLANRAKSALKDNPITLGGQVERAALQAKQFTAAVLKKIGVTSEVADEATMGAARTRIGQVFNDVVDKYSIKFSSSANNQLAAIEARAGRTLTDNRIQNIVSSIREHLAANNGVMKGEFYKTLRGDLGALEGQRDIAPIARELREGLDNAFQQVAGPVDGPRLIEARRQWRNLKIIEAAIDTEGAGVISPSKLANQFGQKRNRGVGVYGHGDKSILELSRLAKAGKRMLPDKLPQSGTAPRAIMQMALPAAAGAAYGGATQGDFKGLATGAVAGFLAPKAIQFGINNPAATNYFTKGIAPSLPGSVLSPLLALRQSAPAAVPAYLLSKPSE